MAEQAGDEWSVNYMDGEHLEKERFVTRGESRIVFVFLKVWDIQMESLIKQLTVRVSRSGERWGWSLFVYR